MLPIPPLSDCINWVLIETIIGGVQVPLPNPLTLLDEKF
jgi:hypothetical protein